MQFEIIHRTHYDYAAPARENSNELRLQPVTNQSQTVESFALHVLPTAQLKQYRDFYSNSVHHFIIAEPHSSLAIESHARVSTRPRPSLGLEARSTPRALLKNVLQEERCYDFMQSSRFVDTAPETWRLAVDAVDGEDDVWQSALRIMHFTHHNIAYRSQSTQVHTHMREILKDRRGVCQDLAHVMLGLCRSMHIPALYVSGYLATESANATHAWTEVYIPGAGWQSLDPTHNRQTDETYVKIGVGRDYADVAPVKGAYKGPIERTMKVEVQIERRG